MGSVAVFMKRGNPKMSQFLVFLVNLVLGKLKNSEEVCHDSFRTIKEGNLLLSTIGSESVLLIWLNLVASAQDLHTCSMLTGIKQQGAMSQQA